MRAEKANTSRTIASNSFGKKAEDSDLSRRERQIMDALYKLGKASAAQIRESLANPPTYTAVRTHLTILEAKGHVKHETDGTRYVYEPSVARDQMGQRAIRGVLQTFFDNSVESAVAALISREEGKISPEQLGRLADMIERARKEGR
jgi:predicted transcriptional regulator